MSSRACLPPRAGALNRLVTCCLFLAAVGGLPSLGRAQTQFDPPGTPPYRMLNEKGEVVNLAPPLIKPVIVTPGEQYVVAINEADGRLAVHDALTGAVVGEPFIGQGAVALAARTATEIWVSCQLDVKIVDLLTMRVAAVLRPPINPTGDGAPEAAMPGGIAFSQDGSKAWVVGSFASVLNSYDTGTRTFLGTVQLTVPHNGADVHVKEPRAIIASGGKLYVVVHKSGNQTTTAGQGRFALSVEDRSTQTDPNRRFPDADVLILSDVTGLPVAPYRDKVGTLGFGITVLPDGTMAVASLDSRNGELVGEASFAEGRVTRNHVTLFDPAGATISYVETERTTPTRIVGALPTDLVSSPSPTGSLYVACQGSANVLVFDNTAPHALAGKIATGTAPRGLALALSLQRLYCYNDGPRTLTAYDVSSGIPTTPLFDVPVGKLDPTYTRVRDGRSLFHRGRNSGAGATGCFSCHPDGREDGLAWDIGKYNDPPGPFTNTSQPTWKDNKAPMVTQSLRGIEDTAPYHWRGEQKDLEDFNGAFENLLHGNQMTASQFASLKAFVFSLPLPPNPKERLNRTLSVKAGSTFPDGGLNLFRTVPVLEGKPCSGCHMLPTGTDASITDRIGQENDISVSTRAMETGLLEGAVFKESDVVDLVDFLAPMTGAGFNHTGGNRTIRRFLNIFTGLGDTQKDNVTQFVTELDTSLAPATTWCELLGATTAGTNQIASYLIPQAEAGHCDLGARGRIRITSGGPFIDIGLLYVPGPSATFVSSQTGVGPFSMATLKAMATAGDVDLLFCGAPIWSGERLFRDRDRDRRLDGDEPLPDHDSNPDIDGDGFWDGEDPNPTVFDSTVMTPAPQMLSWELELISTNIVRISYVTDRLSPTLVPYGHDTTYTQFVGDDATAVGNHWKRHHTAVMRVLLDGKDVHFKIRTLGQNGATAETGDLIATTRLDAIRPTTRVDSITVDFDSPMSPTQVTVVVKIVDNAGDPVPGAEVNGVWTFFDAFGGIMSHSGTDAEDPPATDAAGLTIVSRPQLPGASYVQFCVPTSRPGPAGTFQSGVDHPTLEFAWPESKVTCADTR